MLKKDFNLTTFSNKYRTEMFTTDDEGVTFKRLRGVQSATLNEDDILRAIDSERPVVVYYNLPNQVANRIDYYNCDEQKLLQAVLAS